MTPKPSPTTAEAALDWVRRALADETREDTPMTTTRAEGLVAIAEANGVPIEALVEWIYVSTPTKQWTGAEFRRWCESYKALEAELARKVAEEPGRKLCPRCANHPASRYGDDWVCPGCGVVE
jgi:rubrerythrin